MKPFKPVGLSTNLTYSELRYIDGLVGGITYYNYNTRLSYGSETPRFGRTSGL